MSWETLMKIDTFHMGCGVTPRLFADVIHKKLARSIVNLEAKTFQERLEQAAFQLITKTWL
jgi:hypothetical protein